MIKVPMSQPFLGNEEATSVYETVKDGWISMGEKVKEFENSFAEFVGAKYAVAANNGTTALHLAVIASGVIDGDEVLVPDITFASTITSVMYERAIPVLVNCDPLTYNISIEDLEKKISNKSKAIILVDMNGMPANYDEILLLAKQYDLKVIADSAEAVGAEYKNKKIGSIAPCHIFSFFPNKNITCGEGGMITTNDLTIAERARLLRNMGQSVRYNHVELGFNYRMTDVNAAIGIEQLKKISYIQEQREKIVSEYNMLLSGVEGVTLPYVPEYVSRHAWYMYTISFSEQYDRDTIVHKLIDEYGIETRVSFPPMHLQKFYLDKYLVKKSNFKTTYDAWKRLLNLPIWVGMKKEDQVYVVESLKKILTDI